MYSLDVRREVHCHRPWETMLIQPLANSELVRTNNNLSVDEVISQVCGSVVTYVVRLKVKLRPKVRLGSKLKLNAPSIDLWCKPKSKSKSQLAVAS